MGRVKATKERRGKLVTVTHEPPSRSPDWPLSHVDSELTGPDVKEAVRVTVHGVRHYLHPDTARELHTLLGARLREYNVLASKNGQPMV